MRLIDVRLSRLIRKVFALAAVGSMAAACRSAGPPRSVWTTGDPGAPPQVAEVYRAVLDEIFPRDSGPSLVVIDQLTELSLIEIDATEKVPRHPRSGVITPFAYRIPLTFVDSVTRFRLGNEARAADSAANFARNTTALYFRRWAAPYIDAFPGAWGRLTLGRVGLNSRKDSAVVYVRFSGYAPDAGSGQEVFKLARTDSVWRVINRTQRDYVAIKPRPLPSTMLYGWVDSSAIPPPERRRVEVSLRDSATGAAIPAFAILIKAGPVSKDGIPDQSKPLEPWKNFFTDSAGEVTVRNPPRGDLQIEGTCAPVRDVPGAKLFSWALLPGMGVDTVIDIRIPANRCAELAPSMAEEWASHKRDVERAKAEAAARAVAGNWWGVLRDSRTGQPVPHAGMRVGPRGGIGASDSTGHFWLWGFAPGAQRLTIYCPVKRQWPSKIAATVNFVARPAMKDTLDVSASMSGCTDVPVDTVHVRTRGVWTFGFEAGSFHPCQPFTQIPMGGYRDYGFAFVVFASDNVRPKAGWPNVAEVNGTMRLFLDVEGDLIGPGSYGHMGVGTFLLRVTRVINAREATGNNCSK